MSVCDFCKDELNFPYWDFPCENFTIEMLLQHKETKKIIRKHFEMEGGWLACNQCHDKIVETDDTPESIQKIIIYLAKRNKEVLGEQLSDFDLQALEAFWEGFHQNRTGPPVRVDEEQSEHQPTNER